MRIADDLQGADSDVTRILPSLLIGSAPQTQNDVAQLVTLGVTAVLNLQTDDELPGGPTTRARQWYKALDVELHRVEIEDFSPQAIIARLDEAVAALDDLLRNGHTVYLHCTAGVNRSPSIAVAYLCRAEGLSVEEALASVTLRRPQARPYEDVVAALRPPA